MTRIVRIPNADEQSVDYGMYVDLDAIGQQDGGSSEGATMSEQGEEHDGLYAWMIERRSVIGNESSTPLWWDGRDFSPDPLAGIRFARKADAERVIETHGLMHAVATDHKWCSTNPLALSPPEIDGEGR